MPGVVEAPKLADVTAAVDVLSGLLGRLDPESVPLPDATSVWEQFERGERLMHSAKVAMVRRVDESRQWQRSGYRTVSEFLSAKGGTTPGEASKQLDTSKKLRNAPPVVREAARNGGLSGPQLDLVAGAAVVNPEAAGTLVDKARHGTFRELRDTAAHARAAADADREATERHIHRRRYLRTWTEDDGTWRAALAGTIADGARIESALKPTIDRIFKTNAKAGIREGRDAYAFDALVETADTNRRTSRDSRHPDKGTRGDNGTGGDKGSEASGQDGSGNGPPGELPIRYLTQIRVDIEALQRGTTVGDELCDMPGLGPIPVARARDLLGESLLRIVLTRGQDVAAIAPAGQGWTAAQRSAATWNIEGCSVIGCTCPRIELDHRHEYHDGGPTHIDNADPLCAQHHRLKTHKDWALEPGTGKRRLVPPHDPRHPRNTGAPLQDTG